MTVKELIEALQKMPCEANVKCNGQLVRIVFLDQVNEDAVTVGLL